MRNIFNRSFGAVLLCMTLSLCLTGCVKNEFKVDVKLDGSVNKTYSTLYYASDPIKGWIIEGVLQVTSGNGNIVMPTRNPTIVYIFSNYRYPASFFYAERGDNIKITGKDANPLTWDISGNEINKRLSEWRKQNQNLIENSLSGKSGSEIKLNQAVEKYIVENPTQEVSAILLYEYFDRGLDEDGYKRNLSRLKGDAADSKWAELVSRNDMFSSAEDVKMPVKLMVNAVGSGIDTITPGTVPVMLSFNNSKVKDYRKYVQSLRKLSKESGDSSKRVIANILLEADSMQRKLNARHDSLKNVVEGWIPLGFSDSRIRQMGISRLPYFIVFDAKGKVIYRGDNTEKAATVFKKQIEK